jgi:succinate-semialdehyde dehydrogenase/glutarate-semialdehyde dehydrogenase
MQDRWRATEPADRAALLERVAERLLARADEIARTVTAETGKPLIESYAHDLFAAADHVNWLARNAPRLLERERLRTPQPHLQHKRGYLNYEPIGVVGVISPWNFPFAIPFAQVAAAVAAGNAVVVKPSELTPLSAQWIERLFDEADAPDGLVRVVQGDGEVGAALAVAPGLGRVVFTGSTEVGAEIAAAAGSLLRPVTLELGGKDPMLVFEDADVDFAASGAAWASFLNCGQACTSVERIYVADALHDRFVDALTKHARALRVGRGDDTDTQLGPLISDDQRGRVEDLVAAAREQGASVATGGRRPDVDLPGWFYEPTVLTSTERSRLDHEEVFGPVVTVTPFRFESEAVALANASRYGLGASVWTRDLERARRVASQLDAGMVWTNDHAYSFGVGQASWGGVKDSGFGRTHSKHGLYELSRVKYTDLDRGRFRVPLAYPYDARSTDGFRGALEVLYGRGADTRLRAAWRHRRGLARLGRRYLRP